MKYILKESFVFTALSLQQEKSMQVHHAFLAILIMLLAFLPATGRADIGSGSADNVGFSCPASRNTCTCSGQADCERMRSQCARGTMRCRGWSCGCTKKVVTAAQSGTTAPQIKGTVPTAPAAPQQGTTAPTVPRQGTTTPKQGTKTTPNLW